MTPLEKRPEEPRISWTQRLQPKWVFMALTTLCSVTVAATGTQSIGGESFEAQACAAENKTCSFTGIRKVAYGAAGKYTVKTLTGPVACNNAVFGDPIVGKVKSCFLDATVAPVPLPVPPTTPPPAPPGQQWLGGVLFEAQACAAEYKTCTFTGTRQVAYGAAGKYVVRSITGPVACNNSVFGDPIVGKLKSCYLDVSSATTPLPRPCVSQPLSWTVAANVCTATTTTQVSGMRIALADTTAPTTGSSTFLCVDGNWGQPINPVCNAATPTPPPPTPVPVPTAKLDAARLLVQATYGPTLAEIDRVVAMGADGWITQQFSTPSMDTHWDYVMVRKGALGCVVCDAKYINATMESFWTQAVRGPDQLRQRTVLALSELFVVSTVNSPIEIQADAHASYLDMLTRNAFGNYRTLLEQVSTHPAMGMYLSHLRNEKEDPVSGRIPDENYAREVMQLFSIGLWQLNADGTRKKDGNGRDIPTFVQADVMGLAKVFTGWSWGGADKSYDRWAGWRDPSYKPQMQNYPDFHSGSEKRFLGAVVPAGSRGEESLRVAMDTLFNHPNVGPFIGSQLIKRLVTSNPSPAYVGRVTAAFNNSGGVRGDMKAVLRAVLMDPEARDLTKVADPQWGKLREPLVRFATWMRAFDAKTSGRGYFYQIWNLEDPVSSIGQNPLRAPSVFNWFRPGYAPPGEIMRRGLVAPEFQITHETTVTGYTNFIVWTVERGHGWNDTAIQSAYAPELALAGNPVALLDHLNVLLLSGQMTATTRETVLTAVNALPASNPRGRVITAITLLMISPDFIVQK